MNIQLVLPVPSIEPDGKLINRLHCEATISKTWNGQGESPFYGRFLPNGDFRDLDIRLIIPYSKDKPKKSYLSAGWKISGTARSVTDYGKNLVIIEVDLEGFEISNDRLKYPRISVQLSTEVDTIKTFIEHLLDAGWNDDNKKFTNPRFRISSESDS